MLIELQRIIKSGLQSFKRHGNLSLATCLILVITISLITFLFFSRQLLNFAIVEAKNKADISVYFNRQSSEQDILKVKQQLTGFEEITEVKYLSSEQALEDFISRHKDDKDLMDSLSEVGANPFLASLSIKAAEVAGYEKVANFLESEQFNGLIEKVDFHKRKSIIEKIFDVTNFLERAGIFISLSLISVSLLITFNTIRLAIYNQKEEIKIMRLVGASNWFIRGPFLIQGVICGIVSFLLAFLLTGLFFNFLNTKLLTIFPGFQLLSFYKAGFSEMFFLQIISGLILGIIPSLIAIRKYLEI